MFRNTVCSEMLTPSWSAVKKSCGVTAPKWLRHIHCWAILLISGWTVASVWPSFLGKGAGINALSVDLERLTTCVPAIFDKEEATCEAEEGTYLLSTLCFGVLLFLFSNLISDIRTTKQCFRQKNDVGHVATLFAVSPIASHVHMIRLQAERQAPWPPTACLQLC